MKFIKIFKKQKPQRRPIGNFYQASIESVGTDQLKKLKKLGLSIPVLML